MAYAPPAWGTPRAAPLYPYCQTYRLFKVFVIISNTAGNILYGCADFPEDKFPEVEVLGQRVSMFLRISRRVHIHFFPTCFSY